MTPTTARPNEARAASRYREWMRGLLEENAARFELTRAGPPRWGWLDRSISAPARTAAGQQVWLRVITEHPEHSGGSAWTGTADAEALTGIPKPRLLAARDWRDSPYRHVRVELLTRMPGRACSSTATPTPGLTIPATWWAELRATLERLQRAPTTRVLTDQASLTARVHEVLGPDIPGDCVLIERWQTVHGDLHWANLLRDPFGIVDWESWGVGPAGTDAATLYLYSLTDAATANSVHAHLGDILDSPDGRRAQLCVAARLLRRAQHFDDHPELVTPLRDHVQTLLASPSDASR